MNQFFYRSAAAHTAVALMLLAGCGGGTPEVVGTPLVKAVLLAASQDRCDKGQYNTDTVSFVSIDGACTKMFAPMTTPLSVAGSPPVETSATISASETPTASPQAAVDDPSPIPSRRLLAAHARFTWPSLLSWAAANYPQFFRGSYQDGVLGEYTYRYWPSTGHYIGLRNSEQLYVLGPATDDEILYIGTLSALICVVYPDNCNADSDSSSNVVDIAGSASTTAVLVTTTPYSSTIEIESDKDWFAVDMVAGSTYTFNLEGSLNGKGTLADPYLELFSSSSQSLETNDDISYPDNLNSRLTYTPTASGRYFVSASGYSSLGTYQLSVSVTGGTSTGSTGSYFAERPSVSWVERQYPVTSPPLFVFDLNICGPDCLPVVALTMPNPSYTGTLTDLQRNGPRATWNGNAYVTHTVKDQVSRELNAMLTSLWSQPAQPDKVTLRAAINSGFSSATTPGGVTAGAAVSLAAKGFPTGYTASGTGGSGLTGTWCTDVNGNQNCWVFDNNTGSTTGAFYQQSINQYSGTLTNTMTWSVQGGSMTYRFTRSTLTNSAQNYDNPLTQPAYTFQYTVVGNSFTFQNIVFIRK